MSGETASHKSLEPSHPEERNERRFLIDYIADIASIRSSTNVTPRAPPTLSELSTPSSDEAQNAAEHGASPLPTRPAVALTSSRASSRFVSAFARRTPPPPQDGSDSGVSLSTQREGEAVRASAARELQATTTTAAAAAVAAGDTKAAAAVAAAAHVPSFEEILQEFTALSKKARAAPRVTVAGVMQEWQKTYDAASQHGAAAASATGTFHDPLGEAFLSDLRTSRVKRTALGSVLSQYESLGTVAHAAAQAEEAKAQRTQRISGSGSGSAAASSSSSARPPLTFVYDPLLVQSRNIDSILERIAEDQKPKASSFFFSRHNSNRGSGSRQVAFTGTALPAKLDMPLHLRCDFCRRHDSMCSKCHRAWADTQSDLARQIAYNLYSALPLSCRQQLVRLSSAHGTGAFLGLQRLVDPVVRWRCHVRAVPHFARYTESSMRELVQVIGDFLFPVHLAILYGNLDALQQLLTPVSPGHDSVLLFPSLLTGVDPTRLNPGFAALPAVARALAGSAVYREYVASQLARRLLGVWETERAEQVLCRLLTDAPTSVVGFFSLAVVLLCRGQIALARRVGRHLRRLVCRPSATASSNRSCNAGIARVLVTDCFLDNLDYLLAQSSDPEAGDSSAAGTGAETPSVGTASAVATGSAGTAVSVCRRTTTGSFSLRSLPFHAVCLRILSFCDATTLRAVHHATRIPLLRSAAGRLAAEQPSVFLTPLFTESRGYDDVVPTLFAYTAASGGDHDALLEPGSAQPLGSARVLAMARDFKVFVVQCSLLGIRRGSTPESTSTAGTTTDAVRNMELTRIVVSRQYRVNRLRSSAPWEVLPTSDWELDVTLTRQFHSYLRSRGTSLSPSQ